MSRTSASTNDLRCDECNRCLARDGEIECPRCKAHTKLPADLRASAALALATAALAHHELTGNVPVRITLVPAGSTLGYVQFAPAEFPPFNAEEAKLQIVQALAESSPDRVDGKPLTTSHSWAFRRAMELAKQVACASGIDPLADDDARSAFDRKTREILEECRTRADALYAANRDRIDRVVERLLTAGELETEALETLLK